MTAADPAVRLQALADWYRDIARIGGPDVSPDAKAWRALAEHVEGVAKRHTEWLREINPDAPIGPNVRELLAVADAARVTP